MSDFLLQILFLEVFKIPLIVVFFTAFSLYFSFLSKFYHIKNIKNVAKYLKGNQLDKKVSSFGILISCIGTVLGIGNIIGGCMSVKIAGPGVLFWILVSCLVVSVLKFYENAVSLEFKKTNKHIPGNISYHIIAKTFGKIGIILAIIYIFCFSFGYFINGLLQVNQIFSILSLGLKSTIFFSFFALLFTFFVLKNGISRLSGFMKISVPYMFLGYIAICVYSVFLSQNGFLQTAKIIMIDALNFKCGMVGFMIGYGIRRLCFAADVGTGLSGTLAADLKVDPKNQGVISVFEIIFVGISVFCTGFTVVASGIDLQNLHGIAIMKSALNQNQVIQALFTIIVILFGLTTACSCGFLSQQGIKSFTHNKKLILGFLIIYSSLMLASPHVKFDPILNTLDSCLIFAAIINIMAIFFNRKIVKFSEKT